MQYATQLYTLRSLPPGERLAPVDAAGFDGVELVGLDPTDAGTANPVVAAVHVDIATLEADPVGAVERARELGTETLVVPILDAAAFRDGALAATATRLDGLAAQVAAAGGRLLYHNHEFEFAGGGADEGAERGFERLVAATTDLAFELDVGWATAAGADPVALLEAFGDRIPFVHLKDVRADPAAERGGRPVDLGAGDVDLRGCLRAATTAGVEWVVFEHDDPTDPRESVRAAGAWLRETAGDDRDAR